MKKLSTEITTKKGEIKIITVEVDDMYADWLVTQPQEIYHDAVMFEYRTSCTERKETRYIQSLDASMDNGFDIADADLKLRGPGDFFGSRQHGLPPLKIADMSEDFQVLKLAQKAAQMITTADPELKKPENREIKQLAKMLFENKLID